MTAESQDCYIYGGMAESTVPTVIVLMRITIPPPSPTVIPEGPPCPHCGNTRDLEIYAKGTTFCPVCAKTFAEI